jgi:transcriptional regulator with XRE-family HTH domain
MDIGELGHVFGQAREASGLTQARAAALAGLSRVTVSDFERGAVEDLGIAKVERLMRLVGLSLYSASELPPKRKPDWLEMAARSASVRYASPPSKRELGEMLASGEIKPQWKPHVRQVIEEFPASAFPSLVMQIAAQWKIAPRQAWKQVEHLARELHCEHVGKAVGT